MFAFQWFPSYRESNKGSKKRQGPTLDVRFTELAVYCPSYCGHGGS